MRVYLAGPMRRIPEFNRPAFTEGTRRLREAGHEVFSPVEYDELCGFDWAGHSGELSAAEAGGFSLRKALAADLSWICLHAEAVAVLPGWEKSLGATAEVHTAHAIGIPVHEIGELLE
jgi:Domain of unknown function (DUF4406)